MASTKMISTTLSCWCRAGSKVVPTFAESFALCSAALFSVLFFMVCKLGKSVEYSGTSMEGSSNEMSF